MLCLCIFYSSFSLRCCQKISSQGSKWMSKGFCLKPINLYVTLPLFDLLFQHHPCYSQVSRNAWTDICNPDFQNMQWRAWTPETLRICSKPFQKLMSVNKSVWFFYAKINAFSLLLCLHLGRGTIPWIKINWILLSKVQPSMHCRLIFSWFTFFCH